jgi:hypothetical protein
LTKQGHSLGTDRPTATGEAGAPEISPTMLEAGVKFVMEFFPAEWGGVSGISDVEARAVLTGALSAMGVCPPSRPE